MPQFSRLLYYFKLHKWMFFIGCIFVIIANLTRSYTPRLVQKLIDSILTKLTETNVNPDIIKSEVVQFLIYFFGLTLLSALFTFLMRQTIIVASRKIEQDLKDKLYNHIQHLDIEHYKKYTTGDFMSRMAEDVGKIRELFGPAVMYLVNMITTLCITIYFMLQVHSELTFWAFLPLPFLSIFIYAVNVKMYKLNVKLQEDVASMTSVAQESYNGIRIIKSFTLENKVLNNFGNLSAIYREQSLKLVKMESLFMPISTFLLGLSVLVTIYKGGQFYFQHQITLGGLTEFIMYVNNLMWPVMSVGWVANLVQRGRASLTRYEEIVNLPKEVETTLPKVNLDSIRGDIEFKNVSFTYPDTRILAMDDVSFKINHGERWLIVGKTGSGKSTLAELLMKFYTNYSGSITLNHQDIQSISIQDIRQNISYIPQDVFLFSDTVENNIAFASDAIHREQVVAAAHQAQIHHEISEFKDEYQTMVGERGITLSGGQKQRISIARALIKPSPIYLFDDCLSALDLDTERRLIEAMNIQDSQSTMLIITHRIFNQLKFDKVIVMVDGKIIELGTHEELIAQKGYYAELYKKQELNVSNQ